MKKILFLLLLTIASYAQTPTGQETSFDYGIQNNAAPTVAVPNYLTTQGMTGVYGKIEPINLPLSTAVLDSLATKANNTLSGIVTALGFTPENVANKSTSLTASDVLYPTNNAVLAALPTNYAKVVYVNATSPTTATIFDLNNPPVTNDDLLKNDTSNLYIGNDASTWVYNGISYVTKTVASTSNFYLLSTTTDAGGSKTANIQRTGGAQFGGFLYSSQEIVSNKGNSDTVLLGSNFRLFNNALSDGNIFQLNASNGIDVWNYASSTWNKRFTFSSAGDFNSVGNITGGLKVRKISTNTTLANSDNGTIILLTASCTVTLPNGLINGFNCSFSTQTGVTMTYALGGSVVLINNTGATMAEKLSHTIVNTGVSNEYLTSGSL